MRPRREGLAVAAIRLVPPGDPLDVVGDVIGRDLQPAYGASEAGLLAIRRRESATEVHLEPGDLVAVGVRDHLTFETDVGRLDPRARVRAAVDVEREGRGQVLTREALLNLAHRALRRVLRLDDRQLAVLDAGARHGAASDEARAGV